MPLEVCKYSRSFRTKVCQENIESSPSFGYCAAQKLHYFGYKIHAVCSTRILSNDLTQQNGNNINNLKVAVS